MSNLKDTWQDKVDGVSDILADDINSVAASAIESEERIVAIEGQIGDISAVLDEIIEVEEGYIGG